MQGLSYRKGLTEGIPIALGYFFVSFTFGIMGVANGMAWWETVVISMTNLTSAGQFAGVKIMIAGGSMFELALSQLVINLRYALMGISLSQKTDSHFQGIKRLLLGFGITDEIFGVSMSHKEPVTARYFFGLMTLPYFGWAGGTLAGAVFGNIMPAILTEAMSIAIYGMFIAIFVPKAKEDLRTGAIILCAILFSVLLTYVPGLNRISVGFSIIICAVAASLIGAALFPVAETDEEGAHEA